MTTPSKNNHKPRVAWSPDKRSGQSRAGRSQVVKDTASTSPHWTGDVKSSGEALIQAGVDLDAGEALVLALRAQVESAEKEAASLRIAWDERFNVFAGNVEIVAVKPEDITGLGLTVLEEASNKLGPPLAVLVRYDLLTGAIRVHVRKPRGSFGCRIEISPNPVTPGSFVALKGKGALRALSGYASGGWWVRALLFDNENESTYSEPVFVTVP